jgi:hypothetical protein
MTVTMQESPTCEVEVDQQEQLKTSRGQIRQKRAYPSEVER